MMVLAVKSLWNTCNVYSNSSYAGVDGAVSVRKLKRKPPDGSMFRSFLKVSYTG